MSDKNFKAIRKQLRNVVQEIMPLVLGNELVQEVKKSLEARIDARLEAVSKHIYETLTQIDERSKDIQTFLIRNATHTPAFAEAPAAEAVPTTTELAKSPDPSI
jgi:hypothetical protein